MENRGTVPARRVGLIMCSAVAATQGCAEDARRPTAPAGIVATCEVEHVVVPDPAEPGLSLGYDFDGAGAHAIADVGGDLAATPAPPGGGGYDHFAATRSFRRVGGSWAPDTAAEGYLPLSANYCVSTAPPQYPCAGGQEAALNATGDLAVVGYVREHEPAGPAFGDPFPYEAVVELFRSTPTGYVSAGFQVVSSGTTFQAINPTPRVHVRLDGGDVVAAVSWYAAGSPGASAPVDGIAKAYRVVGSGAAVHLADPQLLTTSFITPTYGDTLALRDGVVAIGQPDPDASPTVYFFRRDAGGTFGVDATAAPSAVKAERVHVAFVDADHAVLAIQRDADAPQQPVEAYTRAGAGPLKTFTPVSTLPFGAGNTAPVIESIDAAGERVAVGGINAASKVPWSEVYRWHAATATYSPECTWAPAAATELGSHVRLDPDRLFVANPHGASDHLDAWPIQELVAQDDAYVASAGVPLVVPAADGVQTNDALHCTAAATLLDLPPAHGTVVLDKDGAFTYTADENVGLFTCGDFFTYHLENDVSTSDTARVDLDFKNPLCRRFYWAAYAWAPYIYKGCPDPGPEPWGLTPIIHADPRAQVVDVELGSAVALDVEVMTAPHNGRIIPSSHGFAFLPSTTEPTRDRVELRIASGACSYKASADLVTGE